MAQQTSHLSSKIQWFLLYWVPVILYCCLIIYMSSLSYPSRDLPSIFAGLNDKLVHGVEYGILGILVYRALHHTTRRFGNIEWAIICTASFGISDELHQWFVPNRHADAWDVLANTAGATVSIFLWDYITNKYSVRRTLPDAGIE